MVFTGLLRVSSTSWSLWVYYEICDHPTLADTGSTLALLHTDYETTPNQVQFRKPWCHSSYMIQSKKFAQSGSDLPQPVGAVTKMYLSRTDTCITSPYTDFTW